MSKSKKPLTIKQVAEAAQRLQTAEASSSKEAVNHPSHYLRGGMEAIDVIEAFALNFRVGNCVKYLLRAGYKNTGPQCKLEDLRKARWYLDREIAAIEGKKS